MRPVKSHFVLAGLLLAGLAATASSQTPASSGSGAPPRGGGGPVAELRKQIAGKESQPAETVFKNVQALKGVPAGQLLTIMDTVLRPSLGVKCSFCHDPQNWSSDDKKEKKAARAMIRMTHDINEKYIKTTPGLDDDNPVVTCATCHRGQEKPTRPLEKGPAKSPKSR